MLAAPGVTVQQIAVVLGIGAAMLGRCRRELCREVESAFPGQGRPCGEEVVHLKCELARVTNERGFCAKRQRPSRERRDEAPDEGAAPRGLSHPIDVSLFAGLTQWVL